ncbi:AcrR family transcriptional regulator/DNA-binding XRE family transcriptional regulator [Nocardia kruczakiae]|uniref:AcrR family transcriptional regulator/DNA-binding XRE family transcriptional regulator n=1 Tax=Nocardia kruczakiae TaxID=261477 RepID=A0ABU1X9G6_9NOCA|nr:TetR family transcriptional regulator [Nocardia kruczakiae]MDR7167181.1 AcrR family transcriptional regulator/DNA-binding XRE family transcriptional regulator [Nocardia kruczakiae]
MNGAERDRHGVGSRVRQARTDAGLSLRATAERIGVSPATLSAVENDKTGVSIARLRALAAALDTTVAWLIDESPAPRPSRPRLRTSGTHERDATRAWREFPPLDIDPVLAAAIDSFVETGYHGATMRSIAHRAKMSVPGVYHHYRDKQELLVRALDLTMDELHWRTRAARGEAAGGRDRLIRVVEALALFHTHRRELAFIGASEMRSLTPDNRRRITASRNEIQYLLDADIDTALAEADLPAAHARVAGRAIATMCTSLPQWFRLDGPASPEQIATEYADFALGLLGIETRDALPSTD